MYWNEVKIVTTPIVVIVQLGKTFIASNDFWTFCGSFLLDPSKTINPQENIQINQIISYMVWSRLFIHITLKLSGPRQRVRLNDLLCEPLILVVNFCFDLFWHWTTKASLPGLHNAHYRFWNQPKLSIFETKKNRQPFETDKLTLPPISPASKTTHWNYHPKEQLTKSNFH